METLLLIGICIAFCIMIWKLFQYLDYKGEFWFFQKAFIGYCIGLILINLIPPIDSSSILGIVMNLLAIAMVCVTFWVRRKTEKLKKQREEIIKQQEERLRNLTGSQREENEK